MTLEDDALKFMFADINQRVGQINEWEARFVADVEEKFLNDKVLSTKELNTLGQIYEKATANG